MRYKVLRSFAGHYDYKGKEIPISAGMNEIIDVPASAGGPWEKAGLVEKVSKAKKREAAMRPKLSTRSKK